MRSFADDTIISTPGKNTMNPALEFIEKQFDKLMKNSDESQKQKRTYTHFTNATDTKNVDKVFESCMDVIFKLSMEKIGFVW